MENKKYGHTAETHTGTKRSDLAKTRMAVAATQRQEIERLQRINAELLQSLEEMVQGFGFAVQGGLTAKLIERAQATIKKARG